MKTSNLKLKLKHLFALPLTLILFSCAQDDNYALITYEGQVLMYRGEYVSDLDQVSESELSGVAGVKLRLRQWGPCKYDYCEQLVVDKVIETDGNGKYSYVFRSRIDRSYTIEVDEYPENLKYGGIRGEKIELNNRVVFADIIFRQ